jgi:hypothetical protein
VRPEEVIVFQKEKKLLLSGHRGHFIANEFFEDNYIAP